MFDNPEGLDMVFGAWDMFRYYIAKYKSSLIRQNSLC